MPFEQASRLKLRFETPKGLISVEDLWDLHLTSRGTNLSLDNLAKSLNKAVKESEEESFVVKKSRTNAILELKFDIVKHVIKVRLEDAERKENALAIKAQKEKILGIIADKEDDSLKGKSVASLKKMIKDLG
ncbi:hypothetical protein KAR91_76280 [Candidatus Pacearchaeota archaeon]|nr:hypothetical protein [Candidatus Pacearchaeota archaeon]